MSLHLPQDTCTPTFIISPSMTTSRWWNEPGYPLAAEELMNVLRNKPNQGRNNLFKKTHESKETEDTKKRYLKSNCLLVLSITH